MATVKVKVFVHKSTSNCFGDSFTGFCCDMSEYGSWIFVGIHEFEYEIPADFNPVAAEVAVLTKKLDEMNDEHFKKVGQLKERIQSLLCIENNPTVQA